MLEVRERTGGKVRLGPGTLYGAIKRLKEGGVIEESGGRSGTEVDDERRRYYRLTGFGGEVLAAEVARLDGLVRAARREGRLPRAESGGGVMTSPRGDERAVGASERIYRSLLRAYPRELRDEYGDGYWPSVSGPVLRGAGGPRRPGSGSIVGAYIAGVTPHRSQGEELYVGQEHVSIRPQHCARHSVPLADSTVGELALDAERFRIRWCHDLRYWSCVCAGSEDGG